MTPAPALLAGLALLLAGTAWWARGFAHHALRQARGTKKTPQPGVAYADALAAEALATARVLGQRLPGEGPTFASDPGARAPPVVLVPDPSLGPASLDRLAAQLEAAGAAATHVLDADADTLDELARVAGDLVDEVRQATGQAPIAVGHGPGGLALARLLADRDPPPVAHVVTVGSPHEGTRAPSAGRLAPDPDEAPADGPGPSHVPRTSVVSHLDDRVVPARSARWGDRGVAVPGVGHRALVAHARGTHAVLAAVRAGLDDPPEQGPSAQPRPQR